MLTATIGHYIGQVVQGLWTVEGGGRAGSAGAAKGGGVGQVVQVVQGVSVGGTVVYCTVHTNRQLTHLQDTKLVSGAQQFLKVIKLVLLRDDKQLKFCNN